MPGFNRKGPAGEGAMTGRKMGKCNPDNKENDFSGMRKGAGRSEGSGNFNGRGRGLGANRSCSGRGMRRGSNS